jgi:hypothetical protein
MSLNCGEPPNHAISRSSESAAVAVRMARKNAIDPEFLSPPPLACRRSISRGLPWVDLGA